MLDQLDNYPILSLIALSPLLGILLLLFIPKENGRLLKLVGIATTFVPLVLSLLLYAAYDPNSAAQQFEESYRWIQIPLNTEVLGISDFYYEFRYELAVGGISLPLVVLTSVIGAMAGLATIHVKKRWKTFYIFFLLLLTGMFGVFMARDLFLFFLFFEMTLIPMYFLIGIWGFKERERAANRFLIYNGIGSAIMLIAFFILVNTAGFSEVPVVNQETGEEQMSLVYSGNVDTILYNLNDPNSYANMDASAEEGAPNLPFDLSDNMRTFLFFMLLIGFGIKLPIAPFHTWMLRVHAEAPPSVVMIHSGILLKMGAYGLIQFGYLFFPQQADDYGMLIAILGVVNILYGAALALVQTDLRMVLAYSSVSHMGIVLLGLAAMNGEGLQGAIFQLISHGLISALLFLIVGSLLERTQTTELNQLGGLAKQVPFLAGMLLAAGMASLGLPGLSGFISEFLAFLGLFDAMPWVAAVGSIGIILTAVYVLRAILRITYGPMPEQLSNMKEPRLIEAVPMIVLFALILLIGVYPSVLSEVLKPSVDMMIDTMAMGIGG